MFYRSTGSNGGSGRTSRGDGQVEIPLFKTEEGRYLASSLGDPLIKGLTEVANKRPEDPIAYLATYLYNFARNRTDGGRGQPIDAVAVDRRTDGDDGRSAASSRDEHGQSMLHFAAARKQARGALFQLLQETDVNVGFRDELYRTARDVSVQAAQADNTRDIDQYVVSLAAAGDTDRLAELLLEGYDHVIDTSDDDGTPILQVVEQRGAEPTTVAFLHSVLAFEERRERVHHAIRQGQLETVQELLADEKDTGSGKLLAIAKNSYGRCTLHVSVLCQQPEIVDYLANAFTDTLHVGDNVSCLLGRRGRTNSPILTRSFFQLERTALHYAMGVDKVETLSRLLIEAGAQRTAKDLKGRQPSYYFMNKSDILRLQEEEETF